MEPKKQYKISYTMSKEDIMTFVSGLHDVQMDMIETVVQRKEREGFPEASAVIDHIRNLK
jgi:predicted Rdx family selenoprotein